MSEVEAYICKTFRNADINQDRIELIHELTLKGKEEIIRILKENGYEISSIEETKEFRKEERKKRFLELQKQNLSVAEIAAQLKVSEGTVFRLRNYYINIHSNINGDKDKFKELYGEGKTDTEISDILGYNKSTVSRWRKDLGWKTNKKKKQPVRG